jgi:site-specific DNA recombinase
LSLHKDLDTTILINEKYTGTYIFNRSAAAVNGKRNNHAYKDNDQIIRIPDAIPAIVTKEEFSLAKTMLERRKRQSGANSVVANVIWPGFIHNP